MHSKVAEPKKTKKLTIVISVLYALLLTGIVLFKIPFTPSDSERAINLIPLMGSFTDDGVLRLAEVIENVLIFIPVGVFLCMLRTDWSFTKKILLVVSITMFFEIIQFAFALGKTDITDILGNTLGGAFGITLYGLLGKMFKERTDKIVNSVAIASMSCIFVIFAYLSARHW